MNGTQRATGGTTKLALAAAAVIGFIAIYQTVFGDGPASFTIGALLALALGGGVGRVADGVLSAYVQAQINAAAKPPGPPGENDEA